MSNTSKTDLLRRKVLLLVDLITKGGEKFPKGSICRVKYVERCGLTLSMKNPNPLNVFGPERVTIRCVSLHDVRVLE